MALQGSPSGKGFPRVVDIKLLTVVSPLCCLWPSVHTFLALRLSSLHETLGKARCVVPKILLTGCLGLSSELATLLGSCQDPPQELPHLLTMR